MASCSGSTVRLGPTPLDSRFNSTSRPQTLSLHRSALGSLLEGRPQLLPVGAPGLWEP